MKKIRHFVLGVFDDEDVYPRSRRGEANGVKIDEGLFPYRSRI